MTDRIQLEIKLIPHRPELINEKYDLNRIIFDLDEQVGLLTSQADKLDYLVSIASGLLCGALDILWCGEFSLSRGYNFSNDQIEGFVKKTAKMLGCKKDDLQSSVKFLEKKFPIPSDGNTPDFGGGLQHHLRDFAHHPTLIGLVFSLLTQFTGKSYGTDVSGRFLIVNVSEASRAFIGKNIPEKIFYGTITWFFHLVSDMAGSGSSAGKSGGTGIPGPVLALAKEMSVLPVFRNMKIGGRSLPLFLSKLFNGTLFAYRDEHGRIIKESIIKFDLRGEMGVGTELGRQAIPVIANECIVRSFYFIRHFAVAVKENDVHSLDDMKRIDWNKIKPSDNPTVSRMLTIATGVFTTVDIGEALITQKYWVSVNYAGIGRFAVAVGRDVAWCMKARNIKEIRQMYENIKRSVYMKEDNRIYERIGSDMMSEDKFGLTEEQIEILYNIEYYKTFHDIEQTKTRIRMEHIVNLKHEWLEEWKEYITNGFASFLQVKDAVIHWYTEEELIYKIKENMPEGIWFRLVLLEAMIFEPYYPLRLEKDKKGKEIPSKKYKDIQGGIGGYKSTEGDRYLDMTFAETFCEKGYVKRLRKCYEKVLRELSEVLKTALTSLSIAAVVAIAAVMAAGAFAPAIAVTLVGSNFAGLSGAALTSACLAYLGGGAIAAGGAGMAGGTIAIVGGGAVLGLGVGTGVGGAVGVAELSGKKNMILQSAKLLVSVREIFLNDEHDLVYSNSVYERYAQNVDKLEKNLSKLEIQKKAAKGEEQKRLKDEIKTTEASIKAMKIAQKSMAKFISSFETGIVNS